MKISIITINYNDHVGLEKPLLTVNQQNVKPYEHLIIDGGSEDQSKAIWEAHRKPFTIIISEKDKLGLNFSKFNSKF